METLKQIEDGICLLSFDGGGPGCISQLRILEEFMNRLAFELKLDEEEVRPADYFDMMAGVGFGGLCALLLGRLRMTPRLVADELEKVATAIFNTGDDEIASAEYAMVKLRMVIEDILRRHGHPCNIDLRDDSNNRCKVVVFAALEVVADHCRPFRTYVHPRSSKGVRHTFVDVACAILAFPEFLPPVLIGRPGREERFSGIPHGFHNPMQEVLKESQWLFDKERPVSLVLSLGPGQGPIISSKDYRGTTSSRIVSKTDTVAKELSQRFCGVGEYLRLNVDKGLDNVELDDWHALGSIVSHTEVYLELPTITAHIDRAVQWLLRRNGSVTLEQLVCSNNHSQIKFLQQNHNEQLLKVVKQMNEIVQEAIEKITLVDAVGIRIPISLQLCRSYETLIKVIRVYYEDQRPPGTRLVKKGHFELVSGNEGEVVKPIAWRCVVTPGLTVEMSMIRHDYHTEGMNCPRCGHAYTDWTTKGWTTCVACQGRIQMKNQPVRDATIGSPTNLQTETSNQNAPLGGAEATDSIPHISPNGEADEWIEFCRISIIKHIYEVKETSQHVTLPPVDAPLVISMNSRDISTQYIENITTSPTTATSSTRRTGPGRLTLSNPDMSIYTPGQVSPMHGRPPITPSMPSFSFIQQPMLTPPLRPQSLSPGLGPYSPVNESPEFYRPMNQPFNLAPGAPVHYQHDPNAMPNNGVIGSGANSNGILRGFLPSGIVSGGSTPYFDMLAATAGSDAPQEYFAPMPIAANLSPTSTMSSAVGSSTGASSNDSSRFTTGQSRVEEGAPYLEPVGVGRYGLRSLWEKRSNNSVPSASRTGLTEWITTPDNLPTSASSEVQALTSQHPSVKHDPANDPTWPEADPY